MKGKDTFTQQEILTLGLLIKERINADSSKQKSIRAKMREIGFYSQDDFGIKNLQLADFEMLIKLGRIKITGSDQQLSKNHVKKIESKYETVDIPKINSDAIIFKKFDPDSDSVSEIPNSPGNYIISLKPSSKLPKCEFNYVTKKMNSLEVIYTGIACKSLRKRDYKQHFVGNNAGSSTLRKSLGSLFNYNKIARDKNQSNGRTKFGNGDEIKLSKWMKENLVLFYALSNDPEANESTLIEKFNPPLNLSKNKNEVNKEFRKNLSKIRNK